MVMLEEEKEINRGFRMTKSMAKLIKELGIDFSETCRQALQSEIDRILKEKEGEKCG